MSFSSILPGGWAMGATLTSAQVNAFQNNMLISLDKSTAGDQLAGVITMASGAAIEATVVAGLRSTTPGGIELAGGSSDWPTFSAIRSRTVWQPPVPNGFSTGWAAYLAASALGTVGIVGPGPGSAASVQCCLLPNVHNGSELEQFLVLMTVGQSHSGVPANLPLFSLYAKPISGVGTDTNLGNFTIPTPGSGAAWYNSGNPQQFTFSVSGTPTLASGTYIYYLQVVDEYGTNSLSGNIYQAFGLAFGNIGNMAFP
jgi:hypothetical protein